MSIKVGSKMLYCKVAGDKSSEEVVEVVSVQSEAQGGGVTIFIPSLKRERDTELSRLAPIVEKKATLDTFFGKPKLELPKRNIQVIYRRTDIREVGLDVSKAFVEYFKTGAHAKSPPHHCFGDPYPGVLKELFVDLCGSKKVSKAFPEGTSLRIVYDWVTSEINGDTLNDGLNFEMADEVLLDNQRLLFNQLNSLKESLKTLSQKKDKPAVADESQVAMAAEISELRRLNTSLLVNQQTMAKELATMRAEMALMRQFLPTVEAVPIANPLVALGTKI